MRKRRVIAFSIGVFAAACSIHPLPEDVSRKSTFDIVQKVRCEARAGMVEFFDDPILKTAAVGFDFTFTMSEHNRANQGKLEFKNLFSGGTFALEMNGGVTKRRANTRTFRVIEPLRKLREADCDEARLAANWVYPIAGEVGIDEVLRTYLRLERLTSFNAENPKNIFSDTLEFQTDWTSSIKPSLNVDTSVGGLKLTNATIMGSADRNDTHKVVVVLSRGSGSGGEHRGLRLLNEYSLFISDRRLATPLLQQEADAQTRVLLELERLRNLDEERVINVVDVVP